MTREGSVLMNGDTAEQTIDSKPRMKAYEDLCPYGIGPEIRWGGFLSQIGMRWAARMHMNSKRRQR